GLSFPPTRSAWRGTSSFTLIEDIEHCPADQKQDEADDDIGEWLHEDPFVELQFEDEGQPCHGADGADTLFKGSQSEISAD
ncbi:hypothetical protein OAF58_01320, partial [bacterium]|nr:hypothetical protein [bacterium]